MDPAQPDLQAILAALASQQQRPATSTPQGMPPGTYPPPAAQPPYAGQPAPQYPGAAPYGLPQPTSSGNVDLSSIRPVNSGSVSIADAVAQARALAASKGLTPFDGQMQRGPDRPPQSAAYPGANDGRSYGRNRSRSPPRRDDYRDSYNNNPYRDERRGQNRDYRRDRSNSPGPHGGRGGFSPRGGGGRNRSPLRGDDDGTETMEVDSSLVGLIIGRQGENLRRVEADSQTRIQFVPAADQSDPFRICKITGPRARRSEARAAINKIIEDSGINGGGRGGPDRSRDTRGPAGGFSSSSSNELPALKEGEECIQIMVPDRTVGLIIGRGGETIRDLQERSACHINIVGENKSVNGLRPVNLIGLPSAASMAKNLIMEIVDSDSRNGGPGAGGGGGRGGDGGHRPPRNDMRDGGGEKESIYVPSEAVGMIIGKGGETIREMQSTTGCKINVSQSSGAGETEREIGLVGSRDAINRAKQAIDEKVEAVRNKNSGGGRGGRGGYGGGRDGYNNQSGGHGQHRDYDAPSYGQPSNQGGAPGGHPGAQPPAGGDPSADPYAAYGGYQAYLAMWYQAIAAQSGQPGQGGPPQGPPGA
ncbi:hypothetical protein DL546_000373 [Coniochaeta pulveracea]|uniref:K Homology domain-containing protein n=1 Tax=Coniochaeta pulveracea TaxID=177199 RepID=A0A420XZE7_9PEZI|nr:hypothetical protein DL546_000373 [Coniochaeta pulveracea]